jgi:signal transduction histidine kinase
MAAGAVEVGASITFSAATTIALLVGTLFLVVAVAVSLLGSRTRHEKALATEREAVRLKDEFVSMVSHELRTPLTSIAGFTETLVDGWKALDPADVEEFLGLIHTETRSLSHLVEDILVIPRIEAGRLPLETSRFELRALCLGVTEVLLADTDKEIEVAMPAGIIIEADAKRLQQVIRNLVVNAIKYGGDQILIQGTTQGEMLHAVVSDNGPGIPEGDRDRIFDRFEQGSSGDDRTATGLGLGLPIARKLMRAMGGDLWYEPRFPTGANFFFSLKTAARSAAEHSLVGR